MKRITKRHIYSCLGLLVCMVGCASQPVVKPPAWSLRPKKEFIFYPVPKRQPPKGSLPEVVVVAQKPLVDWANYVQELLESPSFSRDWYRVLGPAQLPEDAQKKLEVAGTTVELIKVGIERKARATIVVDSIQTELGPRPRFWFYDAKGDELGEIPVLRGEPEKTGKDFRQLLLQTWNIVGLPESEYKRGVVLLPFDYQKRVEQVFGLWRSYAPQSDFYWYRVPAWLVGSLGCGKSAQCLKDTYNSVFFVNAMVERGQLVLFNQVPFATKEDKAYTVGGPYRHTVLFGQVLGRLYDGLREAVAEVAGPVGHFVNPEDRSEPYWEWNHAEMPVDPLLTNLQRELVVAKGVSDQTQRTDLPVPKASVAITPLQGKDVVVTWFDSNLKRAIAPTSATTLQRQFLEQVSKSLQDQRDLSVHVVAAELWKPVKKGAKKDGVLSAQWPVLAVRYDKKRKKETSPSSKTSSVVVLSLLVCDAQGRPVDEKKQKSILEADPAQVLAMHSAGGKGDKKAQVVRLSVPTTSWLAPVKGWLP